MPKFLWRVLLNIWELSITESQNRICHSWGKMQFWIIHVIFYLSNWYYLKSLGLVCFLVRTGELCWFVLCIYVCLELYGSKIPRHWIFNTHTVKITRFFIHAQMPFFLFSMNWQNSYTFQTVAWHRSAFYSSF